MLQSCETGIYHTATRHSKHMDITEPVLLCPVAAILLLMDGALFWLYIYTMTIYTLIIYTLTHSGFIPGSHLHGMYIG